MFRDKFKHNIVTEENLLTVRRITALWAFSEAALGGILHALKVPFTGLFIGGTAVIFLSLIANYSNRKIILLQSTIVVILIKGIVSPYTPLNAYFSVFLQGFTAYLLFSIIPNKKISSFLLGVITISFSAFQKVFVLTIVFGNTLWKSIDTFGNYLSTELLMTSSELDIQLSYILIGIYGTIHLAGGIVFGIIAGRMPNWISRNAYRAKEYNDLLLREDEINLQPEKKKYKKVWWKKKSTIVIGIFSIAMILISYLNPQLDDNLAFQILIMLVRSVVITYVWFGLLAPIIIKWFKKYLLKKKSDYSKELDQILSLFPYFKGIINYSWEQTKANKKYKRIIPFLQNSFILLLMADIDSYEKSNSI